MKKGKKKQIAVLIPQERILKNIVKIRNENVILDVDLAELYDVETRTLKQAVRRNEERFPPDLLFELTDQETDFLVTSGFIDGKRTLGGARPFAFTETGIAMLSSVLKSGKAVQVNLHIMRTFVAVRKVHEGHNELYRYIKDLESRNEKDFVEIYKTLKYLVDKQNAPYTSMGFQPVTPNT